MKTIARYIFLPLLFLGTVAMAQERSLVDSISLGNSYQLQAYGNLNQESPLFDKSPEFDVAKALYGQFSGLLIKQGSGMSYENQSKLRLHGHSPLVLVDGIPREIGNITAEEIESITVLKDAASAALYGVKGANGVIMITTKRGKDAPLKVTAEYHYGLATMFRAPEFSDAYTYAYKVNEARSLAGQVPMYNDDELYAFYTGSNPYAYPNVNWWNEIYRNHGDNHRAQFTFTGGNRNFRYFAAIDYMKDDALYKKATSDSRYNGNVYDTRLGIRANVDVNITDYTSMKIGVMARLEESNKPYYMRSGRLEEILYTLPSAAFPVKQADGAYGGSALKGGVNPVALFQESGSHQYSQTKVLADATLRQELGMLVPGMYADVTVGFDYLGKMTEVAYKDWQYSELIGNLASNGNINYLVTEQKYYGTNSKTVTFEHWFNSLQMRFDLTARLNWERNFGKHHAQAHVAYRQRSWIENERNASSKTQEILGTFGYNWNQRIFADVVLNYSGSAYLEPGKRFTLYPAVSVAGIILPGDPYLKAYASAGLSGMDEDLDHELWRLSYGSSNGKSFYFADGKGSSGKAEGNMPSLILAPELSRKATLGADAKFFKNRLGVNVEGFIENRRNIMVEASSVSGVIGISVSDQSMGEENYGGLDLSLDWNDKIGDFNYGLYANGGWLWSKVINDGQEYQMYDYLYHKGNPVGQRYGLEVIGIFQDQVEINNSPKQSFDSEVRPGDLKYRDQNADGVIDSQDFVKMFGSSTPLFQFGFGINLGWRGFNVYADFQGVTGVTVDLRDSPLYQPLVDNGTISNTFVSREVTWTPETATTATMPRLTTVANKNNYQKSSLWYRDGSFIKLRNLGISYTFPKSMLRLCEATIYLKATNLFSLDNIQFADPEQLGATYPSTRCFWGGVKLTFGKGENASRKNNQ